METDREFFERRVVRPETPCWNWRSYINRKGYGTWRRDGINTYVHRVAYELFVGPIPRGQEVHHKCFNRSCVNPDHLELVTRAENMQRTAAVRTHCKNGHPFDEENTYFNPNGGRYCRACRNASSLRARKKRKTYGRLARECKNGHPRSPENLYYSKDGKRRRCRQCDRERALKTGGYKDPARLRATHCPQGHEFTPENTYEYERNGRKYRYCRECNRAAARRRSSPGAP